MTAIQAPPGEKDSIRTPQFYGARDGDGGDKYPHAVLTPSDRFGDNVSCRVSVSICPERDRKFRKSSFYKVHLPNYMSSLLGVQLWESLPWRWA